MSINPLGSFSEFGLGNLLGSKPPFLEILAQPNQILSPNGLLQRVIGRALRTQNAAQINDFLEQSGLSLSALPQPLQGRNGESVYQLPTSERFWKSIGTFQQTGNALSLARLLTGNAPGQTPSFVQTNPRNAIASKQGVTTQLERIRLTPQTQTRQKEPELYFDKLMDGKGVTYSGKPDDLKGDEVFGVKVKVKPDDTRESLLREGNRAAVRAAGYNEPEATRIADARTAQLGEQGVTGISDVSTKTAQRTSETDDKELQRLRGKGEMSYYVTGAEIKGYDRLNYQGKLQDAITQGKPLTQEMIERSGLTEKS